MRLIVVALLLAMLGCATAPTVTRVDATVSLSGLDLFGSGGEQDKK